MEKSMNDEVTITKVSAKKPEDIKVINIFD